MAGVYVLIVCPHQWQWWQQSDNVFLVGMIFAYVCVECLILGLLGRQNARKSSKKPQAKPFRIGLTTIC